MKPKTKAKQRVRAAYAWAVIDASQVINPFGQLDIYFNKRHAIECKNFLTSYYQIMGNKNLKIIKVKITPV